MFVCRGLTPDHPSWVGAWWLGFVISGVLAAVLTVFMFLFPKELPGMRSLQVITVPRVLYVVNDIMKEGQYRPTLYSHLILLLGTCTCISLDQDR